jgi:hypothetical protein
MGKVNLGYKKNPSYLLSLSIKIELFTLISKSRLKIKREKKLNETSQFIMPNKPLVNKLIEKTES